VSPGKPRPRDDSEQQDLILTEVSRQLQDVMARQTNAVTRGSIVVGAAAATSIALTATAESPWALIPIVIGAIAAVYGFLSLWLWKTHAAMLTPDVAKIYQAAPAAALRNSFISDLLTELRSARADLNRKNRHIRRAMIIAAVSWASAIIVTILDVLGAL
jgi:hypothetical protein